MLIRFALLLHHELLKITSVPKHRTDFVVDDSRHSMLATLRTPLIVAQACAKPVHVCHQGARSGCVHSLSPLQAIFIIPLMQNVVLISIPSVMDKSMAPAGKHSLHAYLPATEPFALWKGTLLTYIRMCNLRHSASLVSSTSQAYVSRGCT